jgi:hypothetical protein
MVAKVVFAQEQHAEEKQPLQQSPRRLDREPAAHPPAHRGPRREREAHARVHVTQPGRSAAARQS